MPTTIFTPQMLRNGTRAVPEIPAGGGGGFTNTYSLDFDGVDDYLDLGTESTVADGGQFTLSFWIKGNSQSIGAKYLFSADYYNLHTLWTIQNTELYWRNINNVYKLLSLNLLDGDWHHILIVWNPDGANSTIRCFTDGTNEVNIATDWRYGNGGIYEGALRYIGNRGGGTFPGFNGGIDEFAVWNDDQSANVSTIYNGGVPNDLTDLSPNYWLRNGDNGSWKSPQWLLPSNENKDKVSNYSFEFDGVDDYVELGSLPNLQNATQYSISSWFKSPLNNLYQVIWGWFDGADGYLQLLLVDDGSFVVYNYRTSTAYGLSATGLVTADTWYNATVVFDGSGATNADRLKLYINGILVTLTYTGTIPTQTGTMLSKTMWLGASNSSNFWGFDGNIDEVSIFDSAISIGDVWDGSGEPTTISGAVAHYNMGEEANFTSNWLVDNSALDNYSKRSFYFDGTDQYLNAGALSTLASASSFSISLWLRKRTSSTTYNRICGKYPSASDNLLIGSTSTNQFIQFLVTNGGGTASVTSNVGIVFNTWHNVVVVFDGSLTGNQNRAKIYLDGVNVTATDSGTIPATTSADVSDFYFGKVNGLGVFYWIGNQDEIGIFNYPLTPTQVTSVYNGGVPDDLMNTVGLTPPTNNYRMGEDASFNGTNWTVPDNVGANDGTSVNMDVDDLVGESPNYSGGGISNAMTIEDRVGEAPNSDNNALSYNMDEVDRVEDVPS